MSSTNAAGPFVASMNGYSEHTHEQKTLPDIAVSPVSEVARSAQVIKLGDGRCALVSEGVCYAIAASEALLQPALAVLRGKA